MKLKLQTATRAEERSTQKQPTQLNMVAALGSKPAKRPKWSPNLTSSFFSLPRSECIWSSRLQERDVNLVRSARAVLCVSRASGNSARNRPKHISKVSVNSSHTPFSFLTAGIQTPGSLGKLGLRSPAREGPEQVGQVEKSESCGHQHVPEPPACSSLSCCHRLSLCQRRVCTTSRSRELNEFFRTSSGNFQH